MDEFPVLLVRLMDSISMPRGRWTLTAAKIGAKESEAMRLAEKSSMDSYALLPVKAATGWAGRVQCKLALAVEGPKGDWIGFENLEGVRLTSAVPPVPKLASPANDAVLSRAALDFYWLSLPKTRLRQENNPGWLQAPPPRLGVEFLATWIAFTSKAVHRDGQAGHKL